MFLIYEHILILYYIIQRLKIFLKSLIYLNKKEKYICFFKEIFFIDVFLISIKYSIFYINNICFLLRIKEIKNKYVKYNEI